MNRYHCLALTLVLAAFLVVAFWPGASHAVPSIARQTNMSCNQCHTSFGGPIPNFTMTGKKYRSFGYRRPHVRESMLSEKEEQSGERLNIPLTGYLSARFQAQLLTATKTPGNEKWNESISDPTTRFAWFFTGPIGDHFGVWDEWYLVGFGSRENDYTLALGAWDELDLRYVFNPENTETSIGIGINSMGPYDALGFGPYPVFIGGNELVRAHLNGEIHPRQMFAALYGWMNNRWVWQLGYNTGDTNVGLRKVNGYAQLGYAVFNTNINELWLNAWVRSGSDVMPLASATFVPVDGRDFAYRDVIAGISETRKPGQRVPYLAADVENATTYVPEVRWSKQDFGPHSFEGVLRYVGSTEDYKDGGGFAVNSVGAEFRYGYLHTVYVDPWVYSVTKYEFTDYTGKVYKIDNPTTYGVYLGLKPAENFLVNYSYSKTQTLHLTEDATTGGASMSVSLDYLF